MPASIDNGPADPFEEPGYPHLTTSTLEARASNIESNGMQEKYVVLSKEEREKGFVRPLRRSYIHVGPITKYPLRDLTDDEQERYEKSSYVKFEEYPEGSPSLGKYWTQENLDRIGNCGATTTMSMPLAETYARDPSFYGGTFCAGCREHFPVEEFTWADDGETVGS